ncbi:hypothetical protein ACWGQ5_15175 [Streptomyces sp. NPDC055722]
MSKPLGARLSAALASLGVFALALVAASPAVAASGTPTTPTELFNEYQSCSTDANKPTYLWASSGLDVEGIPGDTDAADNAFVTEEFRVWPVSDPTQTTVVSRNYATLGFEATATLPAAAFADGQTYAWQAQTAAGGTASDWSAPCYVTVDNTRPSNTPTVSSPNYPQGEFNQGGAPVQFTFGANGASDVAGFEYSWQPDLPVAGIANIGSHGIPQFVDPYSDPKHFTRADTLGGSATVSLVPPTGSGPMTLWVATLDRAYNRSAVTSYTFFVKSTAPTVTSLVPSPQFDKPTPFKLKPNPDVQAVSPVVSYSVETFGDQGQQTTEVKASSNGTAEVTLPLNNPYGTFFLVSSKSADGWSSDAYWWSTGYVDTTPTVSSNVYAENGTSGGVGVPGTFTLTPKVKGVASYTYSFNWGPSATVKTGGQGAAQIDWTPSESGFCDLEVYATTKDGIQLAPYDYYFFVD